MVGVFAVGMRREVRCGSLMLPKEDHTQMSVETFSG
jgi:hypothetical protein